MFDKKFYIGNRQALLESASASMVVLGASGLVQQSADMTFPFRQDSNFWYLTGLDIADAVIVFNKNSQSVYVVLPEREKHRDLWEGALDIDGMKMTSGVDVFLSHKEGWARIKEEASAAESVGSIVPETTYMGVYGMHIHPSKLLFRSRLRRAVTKEKLVDIRKDMARLRQVKQAPEITAIRKAVAITDQSLLALKAAIKGMKTEQEVDIFLSERFRSLGGHGHGYDPIVASGLNAATIHHQKNDGILAKNELLLMDVGAKYHGYSADVSRTWSIGTPTKVQKDIYNAVLETQTFAIGLLKPSVIIRDFQKEVVAYQINALINAGIYKESERAEREKDYPHLISHHLGLDVHDAGMYDEPLVAGAVVTVEPGVYLPEMRIGARIEDDILITATGAENLSAHPPDNLLYLV